ncbi:YqhR family membrane protein [Microaerobacter geothermalis]|uniref:YqhR family membrane protein n=1 Tax=Microaerobacter geothermalis TaxID=674972 RepID=UPI001F28392D|nr:YqhR family membrane protein [Microaerobacter geothermalis]MCF6094168.1 YqhR family membrane protein [Microaerobacter geothermalis]
MVEQPVNNTIKTNKRMLSAISIGLSGGILWNSLDYLFSIFQFTKVGPSVYAKWFGLDLYDTWLNQIIGIAIATLFTVFIAVVYVYWFTWTKKIWGGIGLGVILWALFYFVVSPLFDLTKPYFTLGWNTITTEFCLFLLQGVFVGYTLSVEFNDEEKRNK